MTTLLGKARAFLSPRDGLVRQRADLIAKQAAAGAERAEVLAAAKRRLEEWEAPKREVERLEREAFSAGLVEDRERNALEGQLRARPSPALLAFEKFCDRVAREINEPVRLTEHVNRLTGERTVESDDGGARVRAGDVLMRARLAVRDVLPFVTDEDIRQRVATMKMEILGALDGVDVTALGDVEDAE